MRFCFWGTRGSIATPGEGTIQFGGNTSCVELITNSGKRIIFDCGTGIRPLGAHLMANGARPVTATVLLTHTHWDHIQGLPFFAPLFVAGNRFTMCGPLGCCRSLHDVLAGQMEHEYFPVNLDQLAAEIKYWDLSEGTHEVDGVTIRCQHLRHPTTTLGYRIEADGVSALYLSDHEPFSENPWRHGAEPGRMDSILLEGDRHHAEFMQGADAVIHEAQYTPEEYASKKNWGHSTYSYVVGLAAAAGVRRLYLTHHDPGHDDLFLAAVERCAQEVAKQLGSSMEVQFAREGSEVVI